MLVVNGKEYREISNLTVNGNKKIGRGVGHFSTTPTNENGGTCFCKCEGCYACTGCYLFSTTKRRLAERTDIAKNHLEFFKSRMDWELKEYNYKFFRIHASGDFFSADYVRAWIEIIRNNPQVSFWSYTKAYGHGFDAELDELNALPNCNIVPSIVEGFGYNYGHCGYVLDMYESLKASGEDVYICPCGTDDTVHCNKCHGCAEHKYVLFLEHSTGYKAVEDPQYIDIKELVARQ